MEQKTATAEAQISILKSEKAKLNAEFQLLKTNVDTYDTERHEKEAENRVLVDSLTQKAEKLAREKKNLEIQLDSEKSKLEYETKRFQTLLSDMNKEKELQRRLFEKQQPQEVASSQQEYSSGQLNDTSPLGRQRTLSRMSSSGSFSVDSGDQINSIANHQSGHLNLLDSLQSKIRQKEGEVSVLQDKVNRMERNRESMAKEMVSLTNQLEGIRDQLSEFPQLQESYKVNIKLKWTVFL